MFKNIYGIDLGTYEIKIYDKKRNVIWKEKNAVAINDEQNVFALGDEAYRMYEKSPENIQVVFPMKEGEISRFTDMQFLLHSLLKGHKYFKRGSKYYLAVPTDVTAVQKRAFYDLVIHSQARAKEVHIVERGIVDAIGAGLDIHREKGLFIVNFGAETTELSVLSNGGLVLNKLIKIGGTTLDEAIVNQVRNNHEFLIGRLTAEMLRKTFGIFDDRSRRTLTVSGRSIRSGVPEQQDVSVNLVRAAINEPLKEIVRSIRALLERTPPDILPEVLQHGLYITGGLANLRGLDVYLRGATGLPVTVVAEPHFATIRGLQKVILSKDLQELAYSMLDKEFRWMK